MAEPTSAKPATTIMTMPIQTANVLQPEPPVDRREYPRCPPCQ
jgi:hypothetical protein